MDEWESDLKEELKDPEFRLIFGTESARSEFGIVLYKARRAAGLTQTELSKQLGVSQPISLNWSAAKPTRPWVLPEKFWLSWDYVWSLVLLH